LIASAAALGAPTGGRVVAGSAGILTTGPATIVNQFSNRAIIDWSAFSIGSGQTVRFVLPSSSAAVLNRVDSSGISRIDGSLQSNGAVYLINPNGIVIGPSGQVKSLGFVGSTLDVSDSAFLAGGALVFAGGSESAVTNQGRITAAGDVILIGRQVNNSGQISAGGSVTLAAGSEVIVQQQGMPGVSVRVSSNGGAVKSAMNQLAGNGGNAYGLAINNSGIIRATGVANVNGRIYLCAAGAIDSGGTLSASGGNITVAGGRVTMGPGVVDVSSSSGQGGNIQITGQKILIDRSAVLNADGAAGGGTILVGGSWENADPAIAQAVSTIVQSGAMLEASATVRGDGGTVVARSDVSDPDSVTGAFGTFLAQGGPQGGNGGRIETSGYSLDASGAVVLAGAPAGAAGQWLLDPFDLTITGSATSNFNTAANPWTPTASGGNVSNAQIEAALNGGSNVVISTGVPGTDLGNITVNAPITKTSGALAVTLELDAQNNIQINQPIASTSGALNIILDAHQGLSGAIILGTNLSSNGGFIDLGTGRTQAGSLIGGDVYLDGAAAQSISTGGGALTVSGEMIIANPNGLAITTAGGALDFKGTVDSGDSYALEGQSSPLSWDAALIAAKGSTGGAGAVGDTYLATISSSLENTIAIAAADYQPAWLGGKRLFISGTTDQTWYWVTGPEGEANGGLGKPFFLQNFTGYGGTPINNAYTNWNSTEPNNSGGANTTVNSESALQFQSSTGIWNDLTESATALPYLVETNLPPSPLSINTGSGHATFESTVGGNQPLASLTVTGPTTIGGAGIISIGPQTYNSAVTISSPSAALQMSTGSLTIGQSIGYSGGSPGSLNVTAPGGVALLSNATLSGFNSVALSGPSVTEAPGATISAAQLSVQSNQPVTLNQPNQVGSLAISAGNNPVVFNDTVPLSIDTVNGVSGVSGGAVTLMDSAGITQTPAGPIIAASLAVTAGGPVSLSQPNQIGTVAVQAGQNPVQLGDAGPLSIGNVNGIAGVTAGGLYINDPTGPVSQAPGATIAAAQLMVAAGGPVSLDQPNQVGALAVAAPGQPVSFNDDQPLTVGALDGVQGVTGSTVTLTTSGPTSSLTTEYPVSASAPGTSVVLAPGGNFSNPAGPSGIDPGAGRFLVYSASPFDDTPNGLNAGNLFNMSYSGNPPPTIDPTGNQMIFAFDPRQAADQQLAALTKDPATIRAGPNVAWSVGQTFLFYRDLLKDQWGDGRIAFGVGRSAVNPMAHVSSFDLASPQGRTNAPR
jgi:filamentous hemagglutinin family protein